MSENNLGLEVVTDTAHIDTELLYQGLPPGEPDDSDPYSPNTHFADIWDVVASRRAEVGFEDGKPLVDSMPRGGLAAVRGRLALAAMVTADDRLAFWRENFQPPDYMNNIKDAVNEHTGASLSQHITDMWARLTYHVGIEEAQSSTLLGTPNPNFMAGDERYWEGYYWDTADGLEGVMAEANDNEASGKDGSHLWSRVFQQLDNFSYIIDSTSKMRRTGPGRDKGFIPNGLRTYYLSRSQPPKFPQMVRRAAELYRGGAEYDRIIEEYLPQIVKEYNWWTKGEERLDARAGVRASDHSVLMPDGEILNRYWDTDDKPRPESALEDLHIAQHLPAADRGRFWRGMRIIAESGRDMDGQYLEDPERLETVIAERIVPTDLNAILADTERMIAQAYDRSGRSEPARQFHRRFEERVAAIIKYNVAGNDYASPFKFADSTFTHGAPTGFMSMNMAHPVARGLFPPALAESTCRVMVDHLLQLGGFVGAAESTGHQWNWPNGWAPDQEEGQNALLKTFELTGNNIWKMWADVAKVRWVNHHALIYQQLGRIAEKCNVVSADPLSVQNGEYSLQFGFFWTNGILRKFLSSMVNCPTLFGMRAGSNGLYVPR
jgi:alpha,alpha-trehalase